jgi:3-hydroxyisobutyrate dehydrogenase
VVDAPVSGGVPRAQTGELSIMAGGADEDVASAQPVLRVLGDPARQFRTGRLGSGHAMKALNNVIGAAAYCATAEAVMAGARFGLDPKTMIDIINASTGRSFVSENVIGANVVTGAYATGFALGLMAKDVAIAQRIIAAAGADAPVLALTDQRWAAALGALGPISHAPISPGGPIRSADGDSARAVRSRRLCLPHSRHELGHIG